MKWKLAKAILSLIVWIAALIFFVSVFFGNGGPSEWMEDRTRRVLSMLVSLVGFMVYFIIYYFTNRKGKVESTGDKYKESRCKPCNIALILVLIYVYTLSITLYLYYEQDGFIPVSWMWFTAYTTVYIGYITYSFFEIFAVICRKKIK